MDVVYLCRRGEWNEELRYSLRSLCNLPHDRVWVAGAMPSWVRDAELIEAPRAHTPWEQTTANLLAAAEHPDVSENFLLFNDDFFVMEPLSSMPVLHRGPVTGNDVKGVSSYTAQLHYLARWLREQGHTDVLSYELHVPMEMTKTGVREIMDLGAPRQALVRHKRSLFGNHFHVGGTLMHDCKIRDKGARLDRPFLSTSDASFQRWPVGDYVRSRFPEPSPYEESDDLHDERERGRPGAAVPRDVRHRTPEPLAG